MEAVSILVNEKEYSILNFLKGILIWLSLNQLPFFYKLAGPLNRESQEGSGNLGTLPKSQKKWLKINWSGKGHEFHGFRRHFWLLLWVLNLSFTSGTNCTHVKLFSMLDLASDL